jgi:hypothetical protein
MVEPRFFGDVMPPDDPQPGDMWLSRGVYRVRLVNRWEPEPPLTDYQAMLKTIRRRAGLKARATRERRKAEIPAGQ